MIIPPHGERVLSSCTVPERRESRIITVHNKSDAMEHIPFTVQWRREHIHVHFPTQQRDKFFTHSRCMCLSFHEHPSRRHEDVSQRRRGECSISSSISITEQSSHNLLVLLATCSSHVHAKCFRHEQVGRHYTRSETPGFHESSVSSCHSKLFVVFQAKRLFIIHYRQVK